MDGALEFFSQCAALFGGDAGDEHLLAVLQKFRRDFDDLFGSLARAENHFGEILAELAVGVDLGEAEIGDGRGLEGAQDFVARNFSGAKLLQQLNGSGGCHGCRMPDGAGSVTREIGL